MRVCLVAAAAFAILVLLLPPARGETVLGARSLPRLAYASWYSWSSTGSHVQGCAGAPPLEDWQLSFASRDGIVPCGARVRFCFHGRCVVATRTDSGPWVDTGRRLFDLNVGLARRLGLTGVQQVSWVRVG